MDTYLNIAHCVESYWPATGGMPEVVKQLSERLAAKGHQVTVLTSFHPSRNAESHNSVRIIQFKINGNAVAGMEGETEDYLKQLRKGNYDVVTFFAAQQWATDLVLPHLASFTFKKVFVPTGFSALYNSAWSGYYEKMVDSMKQMDMNVFLSDDYRDVNLAKQHGLQNRILIPNAAAEEEFLPESKGNIRAQLNIPDNHFMILHVGSFVSTKAQRETAEIFLHAKIRNSTLLLVGNGANRFYRFFLRHPQWYIQRLLQRIFRGKVIKYISLNRAETVAAYKTADLFLFPSKIECSPIVLFEAMASGTPFLVTDVGNAKEIIDWGGGGWLMKTSIDKHGYSQADIHHAAAQLSNIAKDKNLRESVAARGKKAWLERFTWKKVALQYEQLYISLVNKCANRG